MTVSVSPIALAHPAGTGRRFILLILCLTLVSGFSTHALEISEASPMLLVTRDALIYQDETGALGIEEIARLDANAFAPSERDSVNFGMISGALWLRFEIENTDPNSEWVIELNNPRLDSVQGYVALSDGTWAVTMVGRRHPVDNRLARHVMPPVPVTIAPGSAATVYLRVEHYGSMRFQARIMTKDYFFSHESRHTAAMFGVFGGLLVMVGINAAVFLLLRERAYLYLSGALLSFFLLAMAITGYGYVYLWRDWYYISMHSVNTTGMLHNALMCLFFHEFIRDDSSSLFDRRLVRAGMWCSFAAVVLSLSEWWFKFPMANFLGLAIPVLLEVLALRSYRRGYRPALYFLLAWTIATAGVGLVALISVDIIEHSYLGETMLVSAYLISSLLWNLSLADRLRLSQRAAQETLEDQVRIRTSELRNALEEVKTLSGLLPICSSCKKIRDDQGYWQSVEHYVQAHSKATFTHGICPDCFKRVYPEYEYPPDTRGKS